MTLGNTVAYFGMRVIQYYADTYMSKVLGVSGIIKFILYIVICLTGPILGILICGIICNKIGGYIGKRGMIFILILNIIACVSSHFITATLNAFLSLFSCWLFLFVYAAAAPLQGGVIISCLPNELKGNGYSICLFFLNALGNFPSSFVYSIIADLFGQKEDSTDQKKYRAAMMVTMYYNYVGLALVIIATIFRFKIKGNLGSDKENEKEKVEKETEKENKKENKNEEVSEKEKKENTNSLDEPLDPSL